MAHERSATTAPTLRAVSVLALVLGLGFLPAHHGRPEDAVAAPVPPRSGVGSIQRFLTPAYDPTDAMGRKPDEEIVASGDVIIIQTRMAHRVAGLRAQAARMGKPIKILLYELPQQPGPWMSFFPEADAHEDWWLHNPESALSRDARVRRRDRPGILDFRRKDVRDFIIAHVMTKWIRPYNLDGYWNDAPSHSLRRLDWIHPPTADQVATWPAGIAAFATEMDAALGSKLFGWNNLTHRFDLSVNPDLASPALDVVRAKTDLHMIEFAYHARFQCVDESSSEANVEAQLRFIQTLTLDAGKNFQAYSGTAFRHSDPTTGRCTGRAGTPDEINRWRDFSFAAYLMQAGRNDTYTWYLNGPVDHAFLQALQVGMPLGPRQKINGVWVREFTGATVKVNLSPSETRDGILPQRAVFIPK